LNTICDKQQPCLTAHTVLLYLCNKLGQPRVEPGCSTNMLMVAVVMVVVAVVVAVVVM
jgi:hypothetical protein